MTGLAAIEWAGLIDLALSVAIAIITHLTYRPDWDEMTHECPDSINPAALPAGYPAYLGYTDGHWPTARTLTAQHPNARIIALTVTGGTAIADGCDCETGDLTPESAAAWVKMRLGQGAERPILYASLDTWRYPLPSALSVHAVAVNKIRRFTAHYTGVPHLCGTPCGLSWTADATQWTDAYRTPAGDIIDMSMLASDFFGTPTIPTWQETAMQQLPTIQQGSTDVEAVRTAQGLCNARGGDGLLTIDGVFGAKTAEAVRFEQARASIAVDGIVGPATWTVLMGVA